MLSLNKWALSNIESIYLDLSALSCNSFPYLLPKQVSYNEVIHTFNTVVDSLIGGDYKSRYSRLKEIVLFTSISDYNLLLNAECIDSAVVEQLSSKAVELNITDFRVLKYDKSRLNQLEYNTNFTASPRDLCKEFDRKKKKHSEETNSTQKESSAESEIEKALKRIKLSDTSNRAFIGALQIIGHTDIKAIYESLSDEFKEENRGLFMQAFADSSLYLG